MKLLYNVSKIDTDGWHCDLDLWYFYHAS